MRRWGTKPSGTSMGRPGTGVRAGLQNCSGPPHYRQPFWDNHFHHVAQSPAIR
ncbi:hypothetical protein B0T16DRAFT_235023 [Cercophora newfieldiana]|uniref:Uncharacterized protein n=1 Tax=Cercophora newfieldiana TaxID=92897 RepID=A0AA40CHF0_9PEZI|nr:hypothetical protein B0T16DRAFT_235023 [Cercophora newfieldiana]